MTLELDEQFSTALPEGRVLGVDLGSRRIGLAVSDDRRRVASALVMLPRGGSREGDHSRLAAVVLETGANLVVVGMPLSLSGGTGPAARAVEAEVEEPRRLVLLDEPRTDQGGDEAMRGRFRELGAQGDVRQTRAGTVSFAEYPQNRRRAVNILI